MQRHKLGNSDLRVSRIGLGGSCSSDIPGIRIHDNKFVAAIYRALELGINFFDTADVYGMGHNEELLGQAVRYNRDNLIIASKFGYERDPDGTYSRINGRPEHVRSACESSLKRLKIDVIDLYFQHRVDANVPIEETIGAMSELVKQGKVRYLGLCEAGASTICKAHAEYPIVALQSEYSLWTRDIQTEILPTLRELNIGLVAFSPLGRGFFTGELKDAEKQIGERDFRKGMPRFQPENFARNLHLLAEFESMAKTKACKPAQLALAWLLAQGNDIVPIPGTINLSHLEENVAALNIKLDEDDLNRLREIFDNTRVAGKRYTQAGLSEVNL